MAVRIAPWLTFALAAAVASPAVADFKSARDAWLANNSQVAAEEWNRLAESGDAVAQCYLGALYASGGRFFFWVPGPGGEVEPGNIKPDAALARHWFGQAGSKIKELANGGNANAQFCLGLMYEGGKSRDPAFRFNSGLTQSDAEAAKWFLLAAEYGLPEAQYAASMMYEEGRGVGGVGRDEDKFLRLLLLAAEQDYPEALAMANFYYSFQLVGPTTPQDDRSAWVHWTRRGAELGLPVSQRMLGSRYEEGDIELGIERDLAQALFWYSLCCPRLADKLAPSLAPYEKAGFRMMMSEWLKRH